MVLEVFGTRLSMYLGACLTVNDLSDINLVQAPISESVLTSTKTRGTGIQNNNAIAIYCNHLKATIRADETPGWQP